MFRQWSVEDLSQHIPTSGSGSTDIQAQARQAWRNAPRCIGRALWNSLKVLDARSIDSPDQIFESVIHHLDLATNGGDIKSVMSVFPQFQSSRKPVRIWNHQVIRYAGYDLGQGKVLGDPMNVPLTKVALDLGWKPPVVPGMFDRLPLIIQAGDELKYYNIPDKAVLEVPIHHPRFSFFEKMGWKWYAVPLISDMIFATEFGHYPCAPFNGYYLGTEIGARNLADEQRYNLLPEIAEFAGLDTHARHSLWKDHALLILNEAVLESFSSAGVKITDHHQASADFIKFCRKEERDGGEISGDWSWLVPPMSPSTSPVFHQNFTVRKLLPAFLLQKPGWEGFFSRLEDSGRMGCPFAHAS